MQAVAARRAGSAGAALFACAVLVACGSGGAPDVGSGNPPPAGAINWGAEQTLATNPPSVTAPTSTFGADGVAAVFWSQVGMPSGIPTAAPLFGVRENTAGATFGPAAAVELALIAFTAGDTISDASSARSAAGTASVWQRLVPGATGGIRLNSVLRAAGGGYSEEAIALLPTTSQVAGLAFAINDAGTRVAVWTESLAGTRFVRLSHRAAGASWTQPASVSVVDGDSPAVTIDALGTAIVVWRQGNPGQLRARSYVVASATFGTELPIDQQVGDMRTPRVATLANGDFVVTWEQQVGAAYDLRASRGSGAGWQTIPDTLELGAGTVDQSRVVAGPNASAYAAWRQNNSVFFARFAAGQWSVAREVGTGLAGTGSNPQIAVDGNGNALFAWIESGTTNDLVYAVFTASNSSLSSAFPLETQTGDVSAPSLSMVSNGAAVVSWLQAVTGQANPNVVARVFRP